MYPQRDHLLLCEGDDAFITARNSEPPETPFIFTPVAVPRGRGLIITVCRDTRSFLPVAHDNA